MAMASLGRGNLSLPTSAQAACLVAGVEPCCCRIANTIDLLLLLILAMLLGVAGVYGLTVYFQEQ